MLAVTGRPTLRVVDGEGVDPERDRADFMHRAADLFTEAATATWATPTERSAWASAERQARDYLEAI